MNFHTGGVVPGTGGVNARLLGGEGVLSHRVMRALDEMNSGGGRGGAFVDAVKELRRDNDRLRRDQLCSDDRWAAMLTSRLGPA